MVRDGTYIASSAVPADNTDRKQMPGNLNRRRSLSDHKYGSNHGANEMYTPSFGPNGFNRFAPTRQVIITISIHRLPFILCVLIFVVKFCCCCRPVYRSSDRNQPLTHDAKRTKFHSNRANNAPAIKNKQTIQHAQQRTNKHKNCKTQVMHDILTHHMEYLAYFFLHSLVLMYTYLMWLQDSHLFQIKSPPSFDKTVHTCYNFLRLFAVRAYGMYK